jgi:NAD+ synthase (glutamine-hydrolysing)
MSRVHPEQCYASSADLL